MRQSLRERVGKPRIAGLTVVLDDGMTSAGMRDCLQAAAEGIDFWLLSGCHAVMRAPEWVMDKVCLCQEYGVLACPSGQAFAAAWDQDALPAYIQSVAEAGLRALIMADEPERMGPRQRRDVVRRAHALGLLVLSQVPRRAAGASVDTVVRHLHADLQAGADYILLPLPYGPRGADDMWWGRQKRRLANILEGVGPLQNRLILKTPSRLLQFRLLAELGTKLNLGDVAPESVAVLEGLRRGVDPEWVWLEEAADEQGAEAAPSALDAPPPRPRAETAGPVIWLDGRRGPSGRRHRDAPS